MVGAATRLKKDGHTFTFNVGAKNHVIHVGAKGEAVVIDGGAEIQHHPQAIARKRQRCLSVAARQARGVHGITHGFSAACDVFLA
jgi:hypothetical protein